MKIGEKVSVRPVTFGKEHVEGKVVWIHPEGRYALVEFEEHSKGPRPKKIRLRECFWLARKDRENC